jgi:hypothetical protein
MVSHPDCCIVNEFTKNVCHGPASISLSSLRKSLLIIATLQLWHFYCIPAPLFFQALLHAVADISNAAEGGSSVAGVPAVLDNPAVAGVPDIAGVPVWLGPYCCRFHIP